MSVLSFEAAERPNTTELDIIDAQRIWSRPNVFRCSGLYIYINQMVLPDLMNIEMRYSKRFDSVQNILLDLSRTRQFLLDVLCFNKHDSLGNENWSPKWIERLASIGIRHRKMLGMRTWMMQHIGKIITVAPLKVVPLQHDFEATELSYFNYFNYMRKIWRTMGVVIDDFAQPIITEDGRNIEQMSGVTPEISLRISRLKSAYCVLYGETVADSLWQTVLAGLPLPIREMLISVSYR